MIAGMGIVYAFLYVLILLSEWSSRMVSKFDHLVPDEAPRKKARTAAAPAARPAEGRPVTAPVPGTVLRLSAQSGQEVKEGDELLVMDVMKMETPVTAPCAGTVSLLVGATDKVATGDTLAVIG